MLALSQRCAVLVGEASTTSTRPWLTLHRLAEGLQEPMMFTQATNAAPLLVAGLHDAASSTGHLARMGSGRPVPSPAVMTS